MSTKFRTYLVNLLVVVASVTLVLVLVELGSRYLTLFPALNFQSHIEFRKSRPLPYKDSTYDLNSFIDESYSLPGWVTPPHTRLLIPYDFHGRYITIENGIRKTTDKPSLSSNVIYVFGGSTVFCNEVPDWYTIPSFLQRLANEQYPNRYRGENYGATTVISGQELERLKTVALHNGDIVIFFDGANDAYISIYNKNPEGWIIGENQRILFDKGLIANYVVKLHTGYGRYSKFIDYFLSPYDYRYEPTHLKNQSQIETLSAEMRVNYIHNILNARDYSIKAGAKFFHFLQPTLFSGSKYSLYEYQLRHNSYLVSKGIEKALNEGYKGLRSAVAELHDNHAVSDFDVSGLFDTRLRGEEYYLDWTHVSEKGNAKIARAIFAEIHPVLRESASIGRPREQLH